MDLPLVEVIWIDAAISPEAQGTLSEPGSTAMFGGLLECRDVGYLIGYNRKEIKLAVSISLEDNSFRHSNSIPRGWVRKVIHLTRPSEEPKANEKA